MPRTLSALLLLAYLVGCESEVAPPAAAPVPLEMFDTQLIGEPVKPGADLAVIELVRPGAEPRERRFYNVATGHRQSLVVKAAVRQTLESEGNAVMPPQTPEATLHLEITRLAIIDALSFPVYRVQFLGIEHAGFHMLMVNDPKSVDDSFERLAKYAFEIGISEHGRLNDQALLEALPELTTMANQVWNDLGESLSVPLPEQAIGLGAQWQVDTMSTIGNGTVARTYELVKIEGELLHIREVQELSMERADFGFDPGKVEIKGMTGSGQGEHVIDLRQVAPIRSDLKGAIESRMAINAGTKTLTVQSDMKSERSVRTQ